MNVVPSAGAHMDYAKQIYLALQIRQQVRQPFSVFTGKAGLFEHARPVAGDHDERAQRNVLFATSRHVRYARDVMRTISMSTGTSWSIQNDALTVTRDTSRTRPDIKC